MDNLSNLASEERMERRRQPVSEPVLKAAIRVVEATSNYFRVAEKAAAAGCSVSKASYDRAKAAHDDAVDIIARGLTASGDTAGAVELLRRNPRYAMPGN